MFSAYIIQQVRFTELGWFLNIPLIGDYKDNINTDLRKGEVDFWDLFYFQYLTTDWQNNWQKGVFLHLHSLGPKKRKSLFMALNKFFPSKRSIWVVATPIHIPISTYLKNN
jgi:hypothetical protein